jgi:hypothetical protein
MLPDKGYAVAPSGLFGWREALLTGVTYYYLTSLVFVVGAGFGRQLVARGDGPGGGDVVARLTAWNGASYRAVAEEGYSYRADSLSNVAFFPVYPFAARWVSEATGMPVNWSLLLVAHACLSATFVILAVYVRTRSVPTQRDHEDWALVAFGVLPTTLFFRTAHSEAVFILVTAVVLYGISRHWHSGVLAAIVGIGTATRPVGLALVPPLALYIWRSNTRYNAVEQHTSHRADASLGTAPPLGSMAVVSQHLPLAKCVATLLFGCWGLFAFMAYQWYEFGEPLGFVKTQAFWVLRRGEHMSLTEKLVSEAMLEPVWEIYTPSGPNFWAKHDRNQDALFSMHFANPVYFVGTVALVVVGWRKKWLTQYELLLSAGLLLIPYLTKSYDNAMASFGRFSAVVLPAYIVMGQLLARLPPPLAAVILCISAFFLGAYSALFAAGYRFI